MDSYIGVAEQWTPLGVSFAVFISLSDVNRNSFSYDQRGLAIFSLLNFGAIALVVGMTLIAAAVGLNQNLDSQLSQTRWDRRTFAGFFKHSVIGLMVFLAFGVGLASTHPIKALPFWFASLAFAALSTIRALYAVLDVVAGGGHANGVDQDEPKDCSI